MVKLHVNGGIIDCFGKRETTKKMPLKVIQIKTLHDNYTHLLIDELSGRTAVIDPGSAEPVLDVLAEEKLALDQILLTHHHYDHSGGVGELKKHYPKAQVAIHKDDAGRLAVSAEHHLQNSDSLALGNSAIKVIHLPCHTRGHVAFLAENALFSGDTLFTAGCGKFFEGTAGEMLDNLNRLKTLPATTMIYCGHEYTVENLEYAEQADPRNQALIERLRQARQSQKDGMPLVPATMALELTSNPFLRLENTTLQKELKTTNELDTLIALYRIYYRETPST